MCSENDWECPPLCSGHNLRKDYFRLRQNGTPAGVPFCHFHEKGRKDEMHFSITAPPVKKAFGALRRACRGKAPPSANADRSAAQKPHWGFRCYAALRKRGRSKRKIKNNYSSEDAQSNAEGIINGPLSRLFRLSGTNGHLAAAQRLGAATLPLHHQPPGIVDGKRL